MQRPWSWRRETGAYPFAIERRAPSAGAYSTSFLRGRSLSQPPCLPTKTDKLPSGSQWLHEIKHDGFRIIARKNGAQVRLYSRPGNDLTYRFPLIVDALPRLRSRSCIIDGEAVACDDNGVASFDLIRHHRANDRIFLYAFDLIELNGDDLRRDPLEVPQGHASRYAGRWPWPALQRAFGRRRPDRLRPCPQARPRRHCVKAQGLALSLGALPRLAQNEELGCTGRQTRGG